MSYLFKKLQDGSIKMTHEHYYDVECNKCDKELEIIDAEIPSPNYYIFTINPCNCNFNNKIGDGKDVKPAVLEVGKVYEGGK